MQDQPSAIELVEAVTEFISNHAMPQLQGHAAFHARVAANALDIVKREMEIGPEAAAGELARLRALLARDGTMEELNRELCVRIEKGELTPDTPGLKDPGSYTHLRAHETGSNLVCRLRREKNKQRNAPSH